MIISVTHKRAKRLRVGCLGRRRYVGPQHSQPISTSILFVLPFSVDT